MPPETGNHDLAPDVSSQAPRRMTPQEELAGIDKVLENPNLSPTLRTGFEQTRAALIAIIEASQSDRSMLREAITGYNYFAQAFNWMGDAWTHGTEQASKINGERIRRAQEVAARKFSAMIDDVVNLAQGVSDGIQDQVALTVHHATTGATNRLIARGYLSEGERGVAIAEMNTGLSDSLADSTQKVDMLLAEIHRLQDERDALMAGGSPTDSGTGTRVTAGVVRVSNPAGDEKPITPSASAPSNGETVEVLPSNINVDSAVAYNKGRYTPEQTSSFQQLLGTKKVDGIWGRETVTAVAAFQSEKGLEKVDGKIGGDTLRALYDSHSDNQYLRSLAVVRGWVDNEGPMTA